MPNGKWIVWMVVVSLGSTLALEHFRTRNAAR